MTNVYVSDLISVTGASTGGDPPATDGWSWKRDGVAISGETSSDYTVTTDDIGTYVSAVQTATNFMGGISATSAGVGPVLAFDPISLFRQSEEGVWYDPSDMDTLFQDEAGTTPVTAVEQPVGLMLDKSQGLVLGSELVTNGDFDSDISGWLFETGSAGARETVVFPDGGLEVSITGTGQKAYQVLSTVIGKTYIVTYSGAGTATSAPAVWVSTSAGSIALGSSTPTLGAGAATYTIFFTATTTTSVIQFGPSGAAPQTAYFDNISVKELPGNHAYTPSAATTSRPVLSARVNLLTKTEDFSDSAWTKTNATVTANATTAPDGTLTADKIIESVDNSRHGVITSSSIAIANVLNKISIRAKAAGRSRVKFLMSGAGNPDWCWFDLSAETATVGSSADNGLTCSITADDQGFYVLTVMLTPASAGAVAWDMSDNLATSSRLAGYTGDGTSGIYLWGADVRVSNDGTALPDYQRVNTSSDYDTTGFPLYLKFDGSDDYMMTNTITPGTDKAQVFAGVRKLSDAAFGMIVESSTTYASNDGSFGLYVGDPSAPGAAYSSMSRGNAAAAVSQYATISATAPDTAVLTSTHDIAGDLSTIRRNAVAGTNGTANQGTGDFLAYPLYVGRRGGSSLPFNGRIYSLITRFGDNLTDARVASTEAYVNNKTKAY